MLLAGMAVRFTDGYVPGAPLLKRAFRALCDGDGGLATFASFNLAGLQFSPRIRDIGRLQLYRYEQLGLNPER